MEKKRDCEIAIRNTACLTQKFEVKENMSIIIDKGRILDILPDEEREKKYAAAETVPGEGKLWMPGLVDGHMHTGQQLLKGAVLDELPMIWTRIMLPFESSMTAEKMRISASLAALEMIKGGTTGFIEAGSYFMEEAAVVYEKAGLRGALSYSTMDRGNFPDSIRQTTEEALKSTDILYEKFHKKGNLKVFYSLRALMNCSRALIQGAAERAKERETFLQAHMNEYPAEVNYTLENYKLRPVEYLESLDVLGENFIMAHGIFLSPKEQELLACRRAKIVHCPFSNCAKGVPETPALLGKGICVGLGTDGAAHGGLSLWNEMRIFRSVMNAVWGSKYADPAVMPAKTILSMATEAGAELLGEKGELGLLKAGCKADMISILWRQPHLYPTENPVNTLIECTESKDVWDSMVNGRFLMRDRKVLTLDEEEIMREAEAFFKENRRA